MDVRLLVGGPLSADSAIAGLHDEHIQHSAVESAEGSSRTASGPDDKTSPPGTTDDRHLLVQQFARPVIR